jgi:nucleoside-diphosphate-sugar epimerase
VVADVTSPARDFGAAVRFVPVEVRDPTSLDRLGLGPDDIVYHLAARQYHLPVPRWGRTVFFEKVNCQGTTNLLSYAEQHGCGRVVYFSTDMVYGFPQELPITTSHPRRPLGPYGQSKLKAEQLCEAYRNKGMRITVFRPRLIVGPGRFGVLTKLFRLIRASLPVPLIGDGSNHYRMVSVRDCVSAVQCAIERDCPNEAYNLGSQNPPTVHELLGELIRQVGSRSILVATPGRLTKTALDVLDRCGLPLLYKEQFAIADKNYLVDISKAQRELGWSPIDTDRDMLQQAYEEYVRLYC